MSKATAPLPDWELVLSAAARLQRILPDAVLVGGTAAAIHARHRYSHGPGQACWRVLSHGPEGRRKIVSPNAVDVERPTP